MTQQGHRIFAAILEQVAIERLKQDAKWGEQNHPNGTGPRILIVGEIMAPAEGWAALAREHTEEKRGDDRLTWLHILRKEVYETFATPDTDALRAKLIQVLATGLAWIECIDRRAPMKPGED